MLSDIIIAQKAKMRHITDIANKLYIPDSELELYGKFKAKLSANLIHHQKLQQNHLVLVTAITPTPAGEGKTTTTIGLTDGLNAIGKNAIAVLREPSLGPVFGMKGGAAGGGYAQVVPMDDINLHFNGDFAAIEKANNLLAAMIDNYLQNADAPLKIDPRTIKWKRVMDMNDRALRNIVIGLGGKSGGVARESGFDITAASEIMAILCLSNDLNDLKNRINKIYIGETFDKKAVFASDIGATDAMCILLKDALKPNLVQTLEGNPAIIHGGPFANIAQGTNSVIATKTGLSLSDYVVTEAGFGADLGAEKFINIKCKNAQLKPKAVVIVATIKALKFHGGIPLADLNEENLDALMLGFKNLEKHIENMRNFGIPILVTLNKFNADTYSEMEALSQFCLQQKVSFEICEAWEKGGQGAENLAKQLVELIENTSSSQGDIHFTYKANQNLKEKIHAIAINIYGAKGVNYSEKALKDLQRIEKLGYKNLDVCMAKTQYSFSDKPELKGLATNFEITIREVELAGGAGFIIPIAGSIMRMPGLPKIPAATGMKIDENGLISGLA